MTMTLEFEMLVNEAGDCWEMVAEEFGLTNYGGWGFPLLPIFYRE